MLCERCKENEAKVRLIESIDGEIRGTWLCDNCAKNIGDLSDVKISTWEKISFDRVLNDLFNEILTKDENSVDCVCKACGKSYKEFREKNMLGCDKCYYYFKDNLVSIIKRNQNSIEHIGKIPKREGKIIRKKKKIKRLKTNIEEAISIEDYEKAAVLRDEIFNLEKELKEGVSCDE